MRTYGVLRALSVVGLLALGTASGAQETVTVERQPNTAGTVLKSTIAGGILGSAVAGGVILWQREVEDNKDYDWQETLAWGAAIGLGAGLVWGIVDAASAPDYARIAALRAPVRDGQSMTLDARRRDQSGRNVSTIFNRRF
jgi:hypothetical protein